MRTRVKATVRLRAYEVVSRAVEEGIATGYRRAYKHTDKPDEAAMVEAVYNAVMGALSDVIDWDPENKS